jgi:hypothetical protein
MVVRLISGVFIVERCTAGSASGARNIKAAFNMGGSPFFF